MASLGLPIAITGLSLVSSWGGPGVRAPVLAVSEAEHAELLDTYLGLLFSHPAVQAINLWGFYDGIAWVRGGGLYREDFAPKPAAEAVQRFWSVTHGTRFRGVRLPGGEPLAWTGYYGQYEYEFFGRKGRRRRGTFEFKPGGPRVVEIRV
jgi:hypothetical protein